MESGDEEEGEEEEEEEEVEEEEPDEEDEEEDDSNDLDDEETITDKLRMKIHEALGDSAALTDTVCSDSFHSISFSIFLILLILF